jgi:uncharacterized OsmC-like protein
MVVFYRPHSACWSYLAPRASLHGWKPWREQLRTVAQGCHNLISSNGKILFLNQEGTATINLKEGTMKAEELRTLQTPLKERYRGNPEAAMVTLKAQGRIGEGISCRVETGRALVEAGLHPATGGTGLMACSGDMLLEALAACAGVTLSAVAIAIGLEIRAGTVSVEGDLDFRGTLGVSKETPVGFQTIRLHFDLETNASQEELGTLLRLTERYCVVFQTLRQSPAITVSQHSRQ